MYLFSLLTLPYNKSDLWVKHFLQPNVFCKVWVIPFHRWKQICNTSSPLYAKVLLNGHVLSICRYKCQQYKWLRNKRFLMIWKANLLGRGGIKGTMWKQSQKKNLHIQYNPPKFFRRPFWNSSFSRELVLTSRPLPSSRWSYPSPFSSLSRSWMSATFSRPWSSSSLSRPWSTATISRSWTSATLSGSWPSATRSRAWPPSSLSWS